VDGELSVKRASTRWRYSLDTDAQARTLRVDNSFFSSLTDTAPIQRMALSFQGDTVVAELSGASTSTQRIPSKAGAVPWVNPSPGMVEQFLVRAKAMGGATDTLPIFQVAGGQTTNVVVSWIGGDSATIDLGGVIFRAAVGRDGALLGAVIPRQNVRIARVEGTQKVVVAPPDYSAPAGAPYTAQDVVVKTQEGFTLAGTLTLPRTRPTTGAPAVVMITGSGPENRDEEIGIEGYRPFRQIADTLGRRGIAVLRLDDRGVGGSAAGPPNATSADFANDIRAALAFLRNQPGIDKNRLGLVGHSEGGMIAPIVAATDPTLRGIVLMAGPSYGGRKIIEYQNRYGVEHMANLAAEKRDSVLRAASRTIDSAATTPGWMSYFLAYDPLVTARKVKVPVLVLQGATDRQVTAEQADSLAAAIRASGNRDVTVRVFPQTNHLFLTDPDGNPARYASLPSKALRADVLGAIADWLSAKMR
jgi:dipeptidyl aminopeptidase/acylaminoacyl peptidase